MKDVEIGRFSGRFKDIALERAYVSDSWPIQRAQAALTTIGLSLGLFITSSSDFAYLQGTPWFVPTAGGRLGVGTLGLILAAWLLIARPGADSRLARAAIPAWVILGAITLAIVACAYPATEPTEASRSEVLVFTAYWMSVFTIVVGFGYFAFPLAVGPFCAGLAACYLALAALYWDSALYPKVSQSVLVVMAAAFGWIMSIVANIRTRRRFHVTKLYEAAQRAAEKSEEFQTFLLAATGHDIRQPVYALDLNASALESAAERGDLDQVRRLARRQRAVARNVTGMLSSILQLSYLDTGRTQPSPVRLEAGRLMAQTVEPLRELAVERGLDLTLPPSRANLVADPAIIGHILSNLASNALAHSGGTRLLCGVRRRPDAVELWVADDGKGLCPEPMTLTSMEDLRASEGAGRVRAGLGLEIMFRLAERGGVSLVIQSRPNAGVCARLICPRAGQTV